MKRTTIAAWYNAIDIRRLGISMLSACKYAATHKGSQRHSALVDFLADGRERKGCQVPHQSGKEQCEPRTHAQLDTLAARLELKVSLYMYQ